MRVNNYKAGYICDAVAKVIATEHQHLDLSKPKEKAKQDKMSGLLEHVSSFDAEFSYNQSLIHSDIHPVLAVLQNIVTRGLPARVPVGVENLFVKLGLTESNKKPYSYEFVDFQERKDLNYENLFKLLHIVEPGLKISKEDYASELGSKAEWEFLDEKMKGFPFAKQILEPQRKFSSIDPKMVNRNVDFAFSSPYWQFNGQQKIQNNRGFIIEVDGIHHQQYQYKIYDEYRDAAAARADFTTYRVTDLTENTTEHDLNELFSRSAYQIYQENYDRQVNQEWLSRYTLLYVPIAIARIQKTLIEYLATHPELFEKENIEIAIVERDIPGGALAVTELQKMFDAINGLLPESEQLSLPNIRLSLFLDDNKWVLDNALHLENEIKSAEYFKKNQFDVVLDHSVLKRSKIYKERTYLHLESDTVTLRSSHFVDKAFGTKRRVYCAPMLSYKPLVNKKDDGSYEPISDIEEHINFFIQTIFRKTAFRPGQLPIINRALQSKPVIGLLPTGGGKSLTFQLSAFLQPGVTLVVDPIKSLMEDQVRVLKENWIDNCGYINSSLDKEEANENLVDFTYGEFMFLFVSPERLVIQSFRSILTRFNASDLKLGFSYCVTDEVHCVSDWGHDFRVTYLMLGKNAQNFAKTRDGKSTTLIGLTATASFDVLADVERELQIETDDLADAIISIDNTIRPELFFRILQVDDTTRMNQLNDDFVNMGKNLERINDEKVLKESLKQHYVEFENRPDDYDKELEGALSLLILSDEELVKSHNDTAAVIFCRTKGRDGVDGVYSDLKSESKVYFYAPKEKTKLEEEEKVKIVNQNFIDFTSGRQNHMICTKAFGMGIDKDDIRCTYHYHYSNSLESTIQEAGRAGRDRKVSESTILYSNNTKYKVNVPQFFLAHPELKMCSNRWDRKKIRTAYQKFWNGDGYVDVCFDTIDEFENAVKTDAWPLVTDVDLKKFQQAMLSKENGKYIHLHPYNPERDTLDFFHNSGFRGQSVEKAQIRYLFERKEFGFEGAEDQDALQNIINNDNNKEEIPFILAMSKMFEHNGESICEYGTKNPSDIWFKKTTYAKRAASLLKNNEGFDDFLLLLEEDEIINRETITPKQKQDLELIYGRDRSENSTGKIIYRLYAMGLLVDYTVDYKIGIYNTTLYLAEGIDYYVKKIEDYLGRYLSEKSVQDKIVELENRLDASELLSQSIVKCLNFLTEFSYLEIAHKRKLATDEIEKLLDDTLELYPKNYTEQNLHLKEQVYFYFNAKYARRGFKIAGEDYSLLDDYENGKDRKEMLVKYLKTMQENGTAQNNYKHMIGSCKKMIKNLAMADLQKEWLLYLLRSFAYFATNAMTYRTEAHRDMEGGFKRMYTDNDYHQYDYTKLDDVVRLYFDNLITQLDAQNSAVNEIEMIRVKVLIELQREKMELLVTKNRKKLEEYGR